MSNNHVVHVPKELVGEVVTELDVIKQKLKPFVKVLTVNDR